MLNYNKIKVEIIRRFHNMDYDENTKREFAKRVIDVFENKNNEGF